ncbi:amidohydrolase family protein [Micromonospora zamorensis]|uniref:amidohydrolase family protein n=1 Tax=Micromonospora zamorensis TaxID=709883 RepID=UPI003D9302DE
MTKRAIRVARMFDGERLVDGGVLVLLDDGRIVDVQRGRDEAPEGWPVREEPNGTVLPGLVDAHVHLCADAGPDALGRLAERPETDLDAVVETSLRAHLAAGVTTVRDLGDRRGAVLRWRAREVRDDLPTVVASGAPVTTIGGHCWSMGGEVSGVDGIELCTCVTAAGAHVPDEVADRLAASGVAVCATLGTDPAVVTPPEVVAMAARAGLSAATLRDGAATLHRAGVRLVAGSDAGLGPAKPHGILPETLVEYVACGIPATAALVAATSVGAEVCGLGRRKGRVRPGFEADLLVVDGDPTSDISALRRPLAVYRAGDPVR